MLKSWPNISALTYMELVAASGTINQSMLAYCHYFDIVIALMYLDIQGDYFQMVPPRKVLGLEVVPLNRINWLSTLVPPKKLAPQQKK